MASDGAKYADYFDYSEPVAQIPPQGNRRRVYHGQTIEIHAKDAPIHDLLRIIADTGKVSIVVPDTIDAKVTLDDKPVGEYPLVALEEVPLAGLFGRAWDTIRLWFK